MRLKFSAVGLAAMLVSACGNDAVAPPPTASADTMRQAVERKAAEQKDAAPADATVAKSLETALPGGVMPEFDHTVGSDMSMRIRHLQRTVILRARGTSANEALESLAGQFAAAGFESGSVGNNKNALMQGFWTPSEEGRGLMVVDAGGTHVQITATDSDPDSEATAEGYSALLMLTINSP